MAQQLPPLHFPDDWSSFGPKMQALKDGHRRFVWAYLMNSMVPSSGYGQAKQSALDAGYAESSSRVTAHHLLHRQDVQDAIQELAARELRGLVLPALAALKQTLGRKDHPDRQRVALSVLSRLGMGEQQAVQLNVSGEVQVNHTDAALDDLRRLMNLGVPRDKLIETFGFSGFLRYEKMLAQREGRKLPETIEGEVVSGNG